MASHKVEVTSDTSMSVVTPVGATGTVEVRVLTGSAGAQ
jgi:hypothetical protein